MLPVLIASSQTLIERSGVAGPAESALPNVIVPASFNFPHAGKLLSLSFVLFAGWFADAAVPLADYPQLALTGLVTFFGSLNVAVPFLLDHFRIPADTFQLFLASGVINSRFGTLVAAMHTLTVALLGTAAMTARCAGIAPASLRYAAVTARAHGGDDRRHARRCSRTCSSSRTRRTRCWRGCTCCARPVAAVVHRDAGRLAAAPERRRCSTPSRARGVLRVGYLRNSLPFAFFNAQRRSRRLRRRAGASARRGAAGGTRVPAGQPRTNWPTSSMPATATS